jgi:hypothetical protein
MDFSTLWNAENKMTRDQVSVFPCNKNATEYNLFPFGLFWNAKNKKLRDQDEKTGMLQLGCGDGNNIHSDECNMKRRKSMEKLLES